MFLKTIIYIYICTALISARIHYLEITNDVRRYIALSTFGFYTGGILDVKLIDFRATPQNDSAVFGFSLDKTINNGMNPYLDGHHDHCVLEDEVKKFNNDEIVIYFKLDLKNKKLRVICKEKQIVHIYKSKQDNMKETDMEYCNNLDFDIESEVKNGYSYYNASFAMFVENIEEEGLYNLFFHSCPNYNPDTETFVDFNVKIVEQNPSSYSSADDMPLPALYYMMAVLFFSSGMFWVFLLRKSKHHVNKIHYMMTVLVFLKAISLALHGVNYHYIERLGVHLAPWAILFYVTHLLKGALLLVVLVLLSTGWAFIKRALTPRDKRLFMAVISLQVVANVAGIILEQIEEGAREYVAWKNCIILVDLLCCVCIIFSVTWSIRHLQETSQRNLRKLKLFRHFYVIIVCYIYSTRIIVYLLQISLPFQYGWMHEMFREMATYVFFILTAYKFRPASQNLYFVLNDDKDDDMGRILTESGATKGLLKKVNSEVAKVHTFTSANFDQRVRENEKDAFLGK